MPLWRRLIDSHNPADRPDTGEQGSAAVEFIFVGVLLLVPLIYVVSALGAVQSQNLGIEAGARHIARAVATSSGGADANTRAEHIREAIISEYNLDPDHLEIGFTCTPAGVACPEPGSTLFVTISTTASMPLVPDLWGLGRLASIPITATAAQKVSRFWGAEQ